MWSIMVIILIAAVKLPRGRAENGPSVIVQNSAVATAPGPEVPPAPQQSYNYNRMDIEDIIKIPTIQRDSFMRDAVDR